jgi:hypothetical protein
MSTQQQIDAWNAAIVQKQQEKTGQETILKVQQEQLKAAETARINADLAVQRAQSSGASTAQVEELQRQARLADSAESDARIATSKTQSNIESLDGSIRFNTSQRDQFQASLPAQANPSSTVADGPANVQSDAAEIAPAPTPAANSPEPVTGGDTGEVPGVTTQPSVTSAEPVTGGDTGEVPGVTTQPSVTSPAPVPGNFTAISDPEGTAPNNWGVWNDDTGVFESTGLNQQEAQIRAENLSLGSDEPIPQGTPGGTGLTPEEQLAKDQAAAKANAINQATLNSVYKKEGSADWRVRLQLAPTSDYLYNANPPGILAPLAATNGVIFPYTPQINTAYKANYELYDLVHSNYRGVYYKNSRVDDLNIRGTFTAQDTREADYLLAVIHFFRSVTKMFYGKDQQRGSPPPLVYLSGLGMNQFYGHPCVISSFTYNLPDQVDYIRATNYNNYGTDLLSRRTPSQSSGLAGLSASNNRILNAGLERFFPSSKPTPDSVVASVNNTQLANYVPTKMEIDISLIPVQTRSQVSKQFSLKGFANGDLIKGGFW